MKKAIVIGASSGIGRELSRILAKNGYVVGVMARRAHLLAELSNELGNGSLYERIDVQNIDAAMDAMSGLIERMGGVDLVVISAGTGEVNAELDWTPEQDAIATNVTGFAAIANVAIRHFMERGSGHLVGISSIAALRGGRESPAYNASKAFQSNYLEGLRQKVRKAGMPIAITDIRPGFVRTAMAKGEGIFWAAGVEKAAAQIYVAIEGRRSVAYVTRRWRLIAWVLKILPGWIYERL